MTNSQKMLHFVNFGIDAANCCRFELSLECFQKAYSKCESIV